MKTIIKIKNKTYIWLGMLLIAFGALLLFAYQNSISLLAIVVGVFFVISGMRSKSIIFYDDKLEYKAHSTIWSAKYNDIKAVRMFIENGYKHIEICLNDNNNWVWSAAFIGENTISDIHDTLIQKNIAIVND
ncbi:MAG: DUF308 domain-containing protein [Ignavibacteria bacterium]|nr:DUF308 domain-containing protein [Ignavibacteria bacterium]